MKKFTNIALAASFLFLVFCLTATAQTNVSGGIYANTTWTLANSPYIVTDTVVVFPGDTLTIEPGVTVKFDDGKYMEIRQGTLIAVGTVTDSITFTSSSATPTMGIYEGITYTNLVSQTFDYCIYKYGGSPLAGTINHSYFYMNDQCAQDNVENSSFYNNNSCILGGIVKNCLFYNNNNCLNGTDFTVDSCIFENNNTGVYNPSNSQNTITNCKFIGNTGTAIDNQWADFNSIIKNCIFCNNAFGCKFFAYLSTCTIMNCNFSQNHIGLQAGAHQAGGTMTVSGNIFTDNDTAIIAGSGTYNDNYIYHNTVGDLNLLLSGASNNYLCNNTLYNFIWTGAANVSFPNVCWCDTDSAAIRSKIYDGYNNIAYGLVNFSPFISCDSSVITALPPINCSAVVLTGIDEPPIHSINGAFEIYPNPASDNITLNLSKDISKAQFKIFNMLGELKYSSAVSSQRTNIDISGVANGVYLVEVITENDILREKFIKQ